MNVRTTQVPGELAQYNGWTGPELLGLVGRLETENKRLKTLLTRAADALETLLLGIDAVYVCTDTTMQEDCERLMECVSAYQPLITELRKAAQ